jgi:solute carrier family 13 (sodium-dependent dicarboxylate transporter), member 2/3/5
MSTDLPTTAGPADRPRWRGRAASGGLGVGLALVAMGLAPADPPGVSYMAGVAVLMAAWWVMEVVPLYVTALLPLVLFPLLGIEDMRPTAAAYGNPTIFLFLGGFLLALGLQRSRLHRRVALAIVGAIGGRPRRLVLGFMLATAALSMWISNTASGMVMLPIALSVLDEARAHGEAKQVGVLGTAIMLGVAYSADIGGMATPVGTPPNLVLMEILPRLYPDAPPIGFGQWMLLGLPLGVCFLASGWLLLAYFLFPLSEESVFGGGETLDRARAELGPVRRDEVTSGLVFAVTALLWVTGADLQLGEGLYVPGWRSALGLEQVSDAAVAVAGAVTLFLLPSAERPGEALLDWDAAQKGVPWGLLLLFGGGFALAAGFKTSGLSAVVGGALGELQGAPPLALVALVCVVLTFLTELTSNTATTTLVLPILAQGALSLGVDPRALMIPATLSASCAFMMPVASPTQAIVFGSGYVTIREMVRAGIWFNLLGVALVTVLFWLLGPTVFDLTLDRVPDWAQ